MASALEFILFPVIFVMDLVLKVAHAVTSSWGVSIIILSIIVYAAITPLRKIATRLQKEETELQAKMAGPLREAKAKYKGEEHFNEIERIYKEFNYHPIKSVKTAGGLLIQVPFLLAGLFLLMDYPAMQGVPFLFLHDLGAPDALLPLPGAPFGLAHINLLPIVMLATTLVESFGFQEGAVGAKIKSSIIGFVIFGLIYSLASAIVFYWTLNNFWSLGLAIARSRRTSQSAEPAQAASSQIAE
ncbi:YidC/Oxa1 family membrane protein insertase [Hyphococcus sp.]|uniref:YidC/Oxa1 family membrane protein insertase n=1 Tax=Hyphococcus sp. TaxID=2038636 RepID=UPI0035C75FDE